MEFLHNSPWVLWAVLAVVLMLSEVFVGGFFIFWFGLAAIPTGIFAALFPKQVVPQLLIYLLVSLALVLSTRKLVARLYKGGPNQEFGAARLIGRCGMVLEKIDPLAGKGLVRMGHDQWRAETADESTIEEGAKVEVLKIDGTRLIVKLAEQSSAQETCKGEA